MQHETKSSRQQYNTIRSNTRHNKTMMMSGIPQPGDSLRHDATTGNMSNLCTQLPFDQIYNLGEEINSGAFGVIYEVHHKLKIQDELAVKVQDRHSIGNDKDATIHEVFMLRALKSVPNVILLVDFYMDDDNFYIVQQLAKGGDLLDRLMSRKVYKEKNARELGRNLLTTLQSLHSLNVVHRDLKPENILLQDEDDDTKILLCDFGDAKFLPKDAECGLTTFIGTPEYVAAEIIEGKQYREEVDMWSVGCILYVLLSGDLPFGEQEDDPTQLYQNISIADYDFNNEEAWGTVSQSAMDLISNLLVIDQNRRWTASEGLNCSWLNESAQTCTTAGVSMEPDPPEVSNHANAMYETTGDDTELVLNDLIGECEKKVQQDPTEVTAEFSDSDWTLRIPAHSEESPQQESSSVESGVHGPIHVTNTSKDEIEDSKHTALIETAVGILDLNVELNTQAEDIIVHRESTQATNNASKENEATITHSTTSNQNTIILEDISAIEIPIPISNETSADILYSNAEVHTQAEDIVVHRESIQANTGVSEEHEAANIESTTPIQKSKILEGIDDNSQIDGTQTDSVVTSQEIDTVGSTSPTSVMSIVTIERLEKEVQVPSVDKLDEVKIKKRKKKKKLQLDTVMNESNTKGKKKSKKKTAINKGQVDKSINVITNAEVDHTEEISTNSPLKQNPAPDDVGDAMTLPHDAGHGIKSLAPEETKISETKVKKKSKKKDKHLKKKGAKNDNDVNSTHKKSKKKTSTMPVADAICIVGGAPTDMGNSEVNIDDSTFVEMSPMKGKKAHKEKKSTKKALTEKVTNIDDGHTPATKKTKSKKKKHDVIKENKTTHSDGPSTKVIVSRGKKKKKKNKSTSEAGNINKLERQSKDKQETEKMKKNKTIKKKSAMDDDEKKQLLSESKKKKKKKT